MNTIEGKEIQEKKELPKSPINQSEEELKEEKTDELVNKNIEDKREKASTSCLIRYSERLGTKIRHKEWILFFLFSQQDSHRKREPLGI